MSRHTWETRSKFGKPMHFTKNRNFAYSYEAQCMIAGCFWSSAFNNPKRLQAQGKGLRHLLDVHGITRKESGLEAHNE